MVSPTRRMATKPGTCTSGACAEETSAPARAAARSPLQMAMPREAGAPAGIAPWEPHRFTFVGKLMDAARNCGQVLMTADVVEGRFVATKRVPNEWICSSPEEFAARHPEETERPWFDILAVAQLGSRGFPYACGLVGVYRDDESTYIVTELATEGDLFTFCSSMCDAPGRAREARLLPMIVQIFDAVRRLHSFGLAHGDLSLENILLTKCEDSLAVRVIDFGMSSTQRSRVQPVGKPAYQAPEMHGGAAYDTFRSDAFALGVVVLTLLMGEYPWSSTNPAAGCRCYAAFHRLGFRRFVAKRGLRDNGGKLAQHLSEPMARLLESLLDLDPLQRPSILDPGTVSASVWQEPLLQCAAMRFLPWGRAAGLRAGCSGHELRGSAAACPPPKACRA